MAPEPKTGALRAFHHFRIAHRKEIGDAQQLGCGHIGITDAHAVNHGQGVGLLVHPADDGITHGTALPGAASVQRENAGRLGKSAVRVSMPAFWNSSGLMMETDTPERLYGTPTK